MASFTLDHARQLDAEDSLRHFRSQFLIPTKGDLARRTLAPETARQDGTNEPSIYLCGNSLGLQPRHTRDYYDQYLSTWAAKGVYGHMQRLEDSKLAPWLHVDDDVQADLANIVGAVPSEVAAMATLTANLHLMMASFYRPTQSRFKIILEGRAFPSDHFAVESQIRMHGFEPEETMVMIEPETKKLPLLSTKQILTIIDQHASETALLLLPGVQYYSGQFFDMAKITSHARAKGIVVGWDLAHAVGNVPLQLHDWNVDFAVWCTYKYLNCSPGSIGGCFVHERHGLVSTAADMEGKTVFDYHPRLTGWWGSSKTSRFAMGNHFEPILGATGYSLSNPSVADTTSLRASLDIFKQTSMTRLREKSVKLGLYLQDLLDELSKNFVGPEPFRVITPRNPEERGAQLSIMLGPGLLEPVLHHLQASGVVVDERKPDVLRVAPAALYNSFSDVYRFVEILGEALAKRTETESGSGSSISADSPHRSSGLEH